MALSSGEESHALAKRESHVAVTVPSFRVSDALDAVVVSVVHDMKKVIGCQTSAGGLWPGWVVAAGRSGSPAVAAPQLALTSFQLHDLSRAQSRYLKPVEHQSSNQTTTRRGASLATQTIRLRLTVHDALASTFLASTSLLGAGE